VRSTVCAERPSLRSVAAASVLLAAGTGTASAQTLEWSGYLSAEPRVFFDSPAFPAQNSDTVVLSAVAAPELRYEWHDGDDRVTVAPFLRWDADDSRRSHADLREANWLHLADPWTLRIGVGKVFWGVTESRHLVDIVNQTDLVEDIDEEDKLGQPMIQAERYTEHGTFGLYLLPFFRERTFPADDGRLRGPLPIAVDHAVYQSAAGRHHTDLALRWEDSLGSWDLGVSTFHGTGREPRLVPAAENARTVLVPHYDIITQAGVDLQYTHQAWLLKLEAIHRSGQGRAFDAAVAGFEYTLYAVGDSEADVGLLAEYLYDGRDDTAPPTAFERGLFVGARLSLNDVDDTMLLLGVVADRDSSETVAFFEGRRRFRERWRFETELRWLRHAERAVLAGWRQDSFLTVRLARFF